MATTRLKVFLALSLLTVPFAATGADAPATGEGSGLLTRYMQIVARLESQLHVAVDAHDTGRLDKLLSPFFEIRRAHGVTVSRDQWMAGGEPGDHTLHDLSVYEVGTSAVASFTLTGQGRPDQFIVDVWNDEGGQWRLRVRFESDLAH